MKEWDLIVDEKPCDGAWNMAVDEFLFESAGKDASKTVLRFYRWKRPTVSIGYSQNTGKVVDGVFCRKNGIDIVRRLTGGKLVLHHKEVTYSLTSCDSGTFPPAVSESYRKISEALMIGLKKMGLDPALAGRTPREYARGPYPCFSSHARDEVVLSGGKIIGSAQKRIGSCFLQHGSIPLEESEKLLASVAFVQKGSRNLEMASLSQALGRKVTFDWAVGMLIDGFSEYFHVGLKKRFLNESERESIRRIQRRRYADCGWTHGQSRETPPFS